MKSQVVSIQLLRGLAAFLVVVAHVIEHPMRPPPNSALITGRFGVEIFFVISGFIIALVAGNGRFNPADFGIRRVMRVVPLYWICTLLVFAVALIAPSIFKTTTADVRHLLTSLVFVPSPDPQNPTDWRPLFKLGWTLNYEMFFYLAMIGLFWCRSSLQRAILLTVVMGAFVMASFLIEPRQSVLAFYANLNLMPFICGVWLSELGNRRIFDRAGSARLAIVAAAATAVTVWLYGHDFDDLVTPSGHAIMTLAAVLIVTTGLLGERYCQTRSLAPLQAIGDASYSLYLTHMFVVGAAWMVVGRLGLSGLTMVLCAVGAVAISLVVSLVSYRFIEEPFNRLGRRLGRSITGRKTPGGQDHPPPPIGYVAGERARRS